MALIEVIKNDTVPGHAIKFLGLFPSFCIFSLFFCSNELNSHPCRIVVEPESADPVQLVHVDEALPPNAHAVDDQGGVQINLQKFCMSHEGSMKS